MLSWLNSVAQPAVYLAPVIQAQPQVGPPQVGTGLPQLQVGLPFGVPQCNLAAFADNLPPKEVCHTVE